MYLIDSPRGEIAISVINCKYDMYDMKLTN